VEDEVSHLTGDKIQLAGMLAIMVIGARYSAIAAVKDPKIGVSDTLDLELRPSPQDFSYHALAERLEGQRRFAHEPQPFKQRSLPHAPLRML
jgi:hypothetical protein